MRTFLGLILLVLSVAALEACAIKIAALFPPAWGGWIFAFGTMIAIIFLFKGLMMLLPGGSGSSGGGDEGGHGSADNWFFWSTIIGSQDPGHDDHRGGWDGGGSSDASPHGFD